MRFSRFHSLAVLACCGCAAEPPKLAQTLTGQPEAVFDNMTLEQVRGKIIQGCAVQGHKIEEAGGQQVVCSDTPNSKDAIVAALLIGSNYSTAPVRKVQFTIYQANNGTKAIVHQWLEVQSGFGQVRKVDLHDNAHFNQIQAFLRSLGARDATQT